MDGEGCFTIGYKESKKTFYIRAILSQKDDIEQIRQVTGGCIESQKATQAKSIVMKDLVMKDLAKSELAKSEGKNTE